VRLVSEQPLLLLRLLLLQSGQFDISRKTQSAATQSNRRRNLNLLVGAAAVRTLTAAGSGPGAAALNLQLHSPRGRSLQHSPTGYSLQQPSQTGGTKGREQTL
jgi:hypothetical protein